MADGGDIIFKFLGDDKQLKAALGGIGKVGTTVLKGLATGAVAVAGSFAAIVTASVKARGEIEQSIGGVETLFKESADVVIANANRAYKTAGISANEYMQGVTSFSARLLQSLGGDTRKAADIADMAFIDMADNANKFNTSMESIQNAYQGFARQNYMMLDNLKLGYSGTKQEMERLLKDAQKISGIKYDINNLADVYNAIHVIQQELGITGTTAAEAEKTLTGSIAAAQAAWENFLSGSGKLSEFIDSASIALDNIIRIVEEAMPDIMSQIQENMPKILELGGKLLDAIVDGIIENLPAILDTVLVIVEKLSDAFMENSEKIGDISYELMKIMIKGFIDSIPRLIACAVELMVAFLMALNEANGDLWVAGFEWLMSVIKGIKNTIDKIIAVAKVIIDIFKDYIGGLKDKAKKWGTDFIMGFVNGILDNMRKLLESVGNIANSIREKLHFSKPDNGPLRDYETWMPDMIKGMTLSLKKAEPMLLKEVGALANAMDLSPTINGSSSYSPNVNVVVNNSYEQDPLGQMVNTIKTFSNGAKNDYNYGYGG